MSLQMSDELICTAFSLVMTCNQTDSQKQGGEDYPDSDMSHQLQSR